jgi:hypothetical protein
VGSSRAFLSKVLASKWALRDRFDRIELLLARRPKAIPDGISRLRHGYVLAVQKSRCCSANLHSARTAA